MLTCLNGKWLVLKIPNASAPVIPGLKTFLVLQDKSHNEINNDRGTEGKKR
jgi:hypothetical protein